MLLYIKVLALDGIYIFIVDKFLIWDIISILNSQILKLKIVNFQTTLDVDMVYTNILALNIIYKFVDIFYLI
jgi:hypothetical protein